MMLRCVSCPEIFLRTNGKGMWRVEGGGKGVYIFPSNVRAADVNF